MTIPNTAIASSTTIDAISTVVIATTATTGRNSEVNGPPTATAAATTDDNHNNHNAENNDGDDDNDDDDVTVILLDAEPVDGHNGGTGGTGAVPLDWIEQQGPEMEARRRAILLRELQRTQCVSCCHFVLLCTVPLVLLIIVLTAILGDHVDCSSYVTYCEYEPRTFTNAFTTRCLCDPIPILRTNLEGR